ncbi:MAG: hypothetical protein MUO72_16370 [Bacteroidales bacterium]|nr:hypothetical protein [Bacteroidales bacterium]
MNLITAPGSIISVSPEGTVARPLIKYGELAFVQVPYTSVLSLIMVCAFSNRPVNINVVRKKAAFFIVEIVFGL